MAYLRKGDIPPTKGRGSKLSNKMTRFVDEYMVDLNATQAVLRAGYKTKIPTKLGIELMNHPLVKQAVQERMAAKREDNELTAQYVLAKLQQIVENTESDNPQAALRGLELLGKHLGLYRDRQEISGPDGGAIEMEQKVKEDAANFARKLARLAQSGGKGEVVEFPDRSGDGRA